MDERDSAIKEKLSSVKDTSAEVKQLEDQAAAIMKAARAEISAALNKMKKETQQEVEQKIAEGRKKVEAELQEALASLESQKEETIKSLDSQIAALSDEIVKKVLPKLLTDINLLGTYWIKDGDKTQKAVKADIGEVNERVNHHQDDLLKNHQINIHDNRCVVANLNPGWFIYLEGGSHTNWQSLERRIQQKSSALRSHDGLHEWKTFTSS
ncbi:hypothetical protein R3W88_017225 [Solanum pinnatisectum]|uniref:Uncharacterized protein n=1 Tax=Solanum pinnatisectum TaxID=50273 RepID=A0AAV9L3S4_9SOLN|nr:hypothetical protein R3W88_017225 [Solanum pinnatisectum]